MTIPGSPAAPPPNQVNTERGLYPPTEWEGQRVTWSELDWSTLQRSLPAVEAMSLRNSRNTEHPHNVGVTLTWPKNGELTTPEREAWNGRVMGAGRRTGIVAPLRVAEALAANAKSSSINAPDRWHTCWTPCGDWWALRGRWKAEEPHPAGPGPIELMMTVEHEICAGLLTLHAGWRNSKNGAEIGTRQWRVRITRGDLALNRLRGAAVIEAALQVLNRTTEVLESWSTEGMDRGTLVAWAAAVAAPRFGRDMPARLLDRFGQRDRSEGTEGRAGSMRLRSIRDIAWALAERTLEEPDIKRRMVIQGSIVDSVADLPWWNAPHDPDSLHPKEAGNPAQVH